MPDRDEMEVNEADDGLQAAKRLMELAARHLERKEYLEYLGLTNRWAKRWVQKLQEFEDAQPKEGR